MSNIPFINDPQALNNKTVNIFASSITTNNLDTSTINGEPVAVVSPDLVIVEDGDFPTSFRSNTTYCFLGSRVVSTGVNLSAYENICFQGKCRDNCLIQYSGVGAFITTTDQNFTIEGLNIQALNPDNYILEATNPTKDKVLTIENSKFDNSYNLFRILGYDLVDFSQNILTRIRGGSSRVVPLGLFTQEVSKFEVQSCEFIRWVDTGGTSYFKGDMIHIEGKNGATFITSNTIHPQDDIGDPLNIQNGVRIEGTTTFVEVLINNNAFVNINLNNGELLSIDPASQYNQKAIQEGNSLLPNLRSRLQGQFSAQNPITNPTTGAINTPTDINTGALFVAPVAFGVIADPSGSITYDRTRPVNFQIIATANLRALSGGANQQVALTIAKNGTNIPIKSFISLDSAGVDPVPCTLAVVGEAVFGDVFTFQLENISAPLDVVCLDINIAGIEV